MLVKLLFIVTVLFSYSAHAEFALEFANNKTSMEWKGASHAVYNYNLKTIGLIYFHNEIGVRLAYGRGRATLPDPGAVIPHLIMELKSAVDLELLYRHNLYGDTFAYWSVGYYWDHLPLTSTESDFYKDDWDNGVGVSIGLEHRMTKHLSVVANYKIRNIIGPAKSHSGALGSSHTSMGIGIKYIF